MFQSSTRRSGRHDTNALSNIARGADIAFDLPVAQRGTVLASSNRYDAAIDASFEAIHNWWQATT